MDTKRRAMGLFIAAIIVLSFTLASASARILDKSTEVGESGITATITGISDEDTSSFLPMQDNGEFEWEVNKTVWDPVTNTWVEEITAQVGDIVTFQINTSCQNLSQLICGEGMRWALFFADINPENFRYVDSNDTLTMVDDSLYWNFTIQYVIEECGDGVNEFKITAYCFNSTTTGDWVFLDEISDTATVKGIECQAPALTPIGLIALVSALSAIAAVAIVRKRH